MRTHKTVLAVSSALFAGWLMAVCGPTGQAAGDTVLTGKITGPAGEPMEGVIVSARQFGKTFTTRGHRRRGARVYFRAGARQYTSARASVKMGSWKRDAEPQGASAALALKPLANFEMRSGATVGRLATATPPAGDEEAFVNCSVGDLTSHASRDRTPTRGGNSSLTRGVESQRGPYTLDEDRNVSPIMHY